MEKLSVIFVGTGEFGTQILQELSSDKRIDISLVITGKDTKLGRGQKLTSSPIKDAALLNKLIVLESDKIEELEQKIIQRKPDFLFVVSYGEIIPLSTLKIAKHGAVNVHPSKLPLYRGASPIQDALIRGDQKTAISWILMDKHMDSGNIIHQEEARIDTDDDYRRLSEKLSRQAAKMSAEVLVNFAKNHASAPQDESKASYCKKITKEAGHIDFHQETGEHIVAKIKAYSVWPGCYIFWNGKRLKITQARVSEQKISSGIIQRDGSVLMIGTKKGSLIPLRLQQEGKREMSIEEFLRGQKDIPQKIEAKN